MKKLIAYTLIAITSISFASAQTNAAKAKEILDKVSAKTKSYSTINVEFSFTQMTKDGTQDGNTANGTLKLKGEKYFLNLLDNNLYSNGKTLWTYAVADNECSIQNIEGESDGYFNPAKMLTMYETGFKYKFIQERFEGGRAIYVIDLYPKDVKESEFSKVQLILDKDKSQIVKIEYHKKDKNKFILKVNKFVTNTTLEDSTFTFDKTKHPGVVIIDER